MNPEHYFSKGAFPLCSDDTTEGGADKKAPQVRARETDPVAGGDEPQRRAELKGSRTEKLATQTGKGISLERDPQAGESRSLVAVIRGGVEKILGRVYAGPEEKKQIEGAVIRNLAPLGRRFERLEQEAEVVKKAIDQVSGFFADSKGGESPAWATGEEIRECLGGTRAITALAREEAGLSPDEFLKRLSSRDLWEALAKQKGSRWFLNDNGLISLIHELVFRLEDFKAKEKKDEAESEAKRVETRGVLDSHRAREYRLSKLKPREKKQERYYKTDADHSLALREAEFPKFVESVAEALVRHLKETGLLSDFLGEEKPAIGEAIPKELLVGTDRPGGVGDSEKAREGGRIPTLSEVMLEAMWDPEMLEEGWEAYLKQEHEEYKRRPPRPDSKLTDWWNSLGPIEKTWKRRAYLSHIIKVPLDKISVSEDDLNAYLAAHLP